MRQGRLREAKQLNQLSLSQVELGRGPLHHGGSAKVIYLAMASSCSEPTQNLSVQNKHAPFSCRLEEKGAQCRVVSTRWLPSPDLYPGWGHVCTLF